MLTATVCGTLCVDLVPDLSAGVHLTPGALVDVGPMTTRLGGCVAGTGGDLAALGAPVTLHARIGDDALGHLLQRSLPDLGAADRRVEVVRGLGTSYSVVVDVPGRDRTFWHHPGASATVDGTDVDLGATDLLHLGYPPLLPGITADDGAPWVDLLSRARGLGVTTSVDLSYVDPSSAAADLDWEALLRATLPLTDVFTPSREDLTSALGRPVPSTREGLQHAAEELLAWGAGVVLVSAGVDGLFLATGSQHRLEQSRVTAAGARTWAGHRAGAPALDVPATSTTGAGDAATAGLLYALLAGLDPADGVELALGAAAHRVTGTRRLPRHTPGSPYRPRRPT